MSAERAKEVAEISAKIDEEQSAEEQPKEIAKLEELKIEQEEGEKEEIWVPNWLIESLANIKRIEMAQSVVSFASQPFEQLCGPKLHGNVKPHIVKSLWVRKAKDEAGNFHAVVRSSCHGCLLPKPIPEVPPPEYILGFDELLIDFLNDQVMEFVKLILPKFVGIRISILTAMEWSPEDERTKAIGRLLNLFGEKIGGISFADEGNIQNFNRLFPGIIDQIKKLRPNKLILDQDFDIPFDWLMNGRQIDGTKLLLISGILGAIPGMKRIKKAFLKDTDRRNFLVYYQFDPRRPIEQFRLENEKTGEILQFYYYQNEELNKFDEFGPCHLLIRCQKDDEDGWKKKGEKMLIDNFDWGSAKRGTSVVMFKNYGKTNMDDD